MEEDADTDADSEPLAEREREPVLVSDALRESDADEEHRAIMQAAIDRKADEAVALLDRHFEKTMDHLRGLIPLE
jgi:DNA-binding GntR family transcriptional regulator